MSDETTPGAGAPDNATKDAKPASAAAAPAPPTASCWLIEGLKPDNSPAGTFLSGEGPPRSWSHDAQAGIRFSRREDAAAIIDLFGVRPSKPTEHTFE